MKSPAWKKFCCIWLVRMIETGCLEGLTAGVVFTLTVIGLFYAWLYLIPV